MGHKKARAGRFSRVGRQFFWRSMLLKRDSLLRAKKTLHEQAQCLSRVFPTIIYGEIPETERQHVHSRR